MFQTPCRPQFIGHIWSLAVLVILSLVARANTQNYTPQANVSIPITSSQIVYTPFVCNTSITQSCNGAWQILNLNGISVSTNGPDPGQGSIIPQMLFRSQAYAIYIYPSPLSNATANITVSDGQASVFAQFNSSVGAVAVLNLQESATTTVSLTFVPSSSYSLLDIMALVLTVPANATTATSLILPTATLPPSMTISIPTPSNMTTSTTTSTTLHASSNNTLIAYSVGITLGLGLGLTTFIVVGYICWRRRRLKNSDVTLQRGVGHAKPEVRT